MLFHSPARFINDSEQELCGCHGCTGEQSSSDECVIKLLILNPNFIPVGYLCCSTTYQTIVRMVCQCRALAPDMPVCSPHSSHVILLTVVEVFCVTDTAPLFFLSFYRLLPYPKQSSQS